MNNVNVSGPIQPTSTYKTKVLKGNHSFASQVTELNMKYVIKHDFVLDGDVTIPENCILEFDGGSLDGGVIDLQYKSKIVANRIRIFGDEIIVLGINEAYPEWVGISPFNIPNENARNFSNIDNLQNGCVINFGAGTYSILWGTDISLGYGDEIRNYCFIGAANIERNGKTTLYFYHAEEPTNPNWGIKVKTNRITLDGIEFSSSLEQTSTLNKYVGYLLLEAADGDNLDSAIHGCFFMKAKIGVKGVGRGLEIKDSYFQYCENSIVLKQGPKNNTGNPGQKPPYDGRGSIIENNRFHMIYNHGATEQEIINFFETNNEPCAIYLVNNTNTFTYEGVLYRSSFCGINISNNLLDGGDTAHDCLLVSYSSIWGGYITSNIVCGTTLPIIKTNNDITNFAICDNIIYDMVRKNNDIKESTSPLILFYKTGSSHIKVNNISITNNIAKIISSSRGFCMFRQVDAENIVINGNCSEQGKCMLGLQDSSIQNAVILNNIYGTKNVNKDNSVTFSGTCSISQSKVELYNSLPSDSPLIASDANNEFYKTQDSPVYLAGEQVYNEVYHRPTYAISLKAKDSATLRTTDNRTIGNIKGDSGQRPALNSTSDVGYQYFDTSLGKPIYWTGTAWVDATGTVV